MQECWTCMHGQFIQHFKHYHQIENLYSMRRMGERQLASAWTRHLRTLTLTVVL